MPVIESSVGGVSCATAFIDVAIVSSFAKKLCLVNGTFLHIVGCTLVGNSSWHLLWSFTLTMIKKLSMIFVDDTIVRASCSQ